MSNTLSIADNYFQFSLPSWTEPKLAILDSETQENKKKYKDTTETGTYPNFAFSKHINISKMKDKPMTVTIHRLERLILKYPLSVIVETDEDLFLARNPDLPLYGVGDDVLEAMDMLKREIESLWHDLNQEEKLNEKWLRIREMLNTLVISHEK